MLDVLFNLWSISSFVTTFYAWLTYNFFSYPKGLWRGIIWKPVEFQAHWNLVMCFAWTFLIYIYTIMMNYTQLTKKNMIFFSSLIEVLSFLIWINYTQLTKKIWMFNIWLNIDSRFFFNELMKTHCTNNRFIKEHLQFEHKLVLFFFSFYLQFLGKT
jgi:hypothetical protein